MQSQNANLFTLICMDMSQKQQQETTPLDSDHYYQLQTNESNNMGGFFLDDGNNLGIAPSSFEIPWA
ncbi:hypothetical protein Leryth_009740 [Lithospermum erythrorhizon]|nr:hypothetical protein Leryth_009740 [Lithospermum erythrorhizon]